MADGVRVETDERGIVWLTLALPERRNAFDAAMIGRLTSAVNSIDHSARAVVLRGEGDVFCAGADLNWMRSIAAYSQDENAADSRRMAEMFRALDDLPMPLLSCVQGGAFGGGVGLVAVSDIAVAASDARFALTEVRLGIVPAVVSPFVIRKVGWAHATTLFTTGLRFDAQRAREIGLVEAVAPSDGLGECLGSYLDAICASGPEAVKSAKRLVREVCGRPASDVRDLTVQRIAASRASEEGQEGMRAFLERRGARWISD